MKVWVVTGFSLGEDLTAVIGVFSTYKKAEEEVQYQKDRPLPLFDFFDIDEYNVDERS